MSIFGLRWYDSAGLAMGQPRPVIVPIDIGAASGSASALLDDAAVTGTGTVSASTPVTGTAALTMDDAAEAGTGTVASSPTTGSANLTLADAAEVGAGTVSTVPTTGAAGLSLDDATGAGAGTVVTPPATGSANITMDDATGTGAGTVQGVIGNAVIVGKGDSISIGSTASPATGALNLMTFPGTAVVTNLGASSTTLGSITPANTGVIHFDQIIAGQVSAYYQGDRPCVAVLQGGTNDIGRFANVDAGTTGADLYRIAAAAVRLLKAMGFFVVIETITARSDAYMTPTKQTNLLDYNVLVRANSAGADRVCDTASIAVLSNPLDGTYFNADKLHILAPGQNAIAPVLQAAIDPLIRGTSARAVRTIAIAYASSPTYGLGRFGLGMTGGGSFVDRPMFPYDLLPRPITAEVAINTSTASIGIMGQKSNSSGLALWTLGINGSGQVYVNINNGATTITCPTVVTNSAWHDVRLIVGAAGTKLEVDAANQVTTGTVIPSGDTRAVRYFTLDAANGVADFVGTMNGITTWSVDRSGAAVPTGHIAPNTPNLLGYLALEGHLIPWN